MCYCITQEQESNGGAEIGRLQHYVRLSLIKAVELLSSVNSAHCFIQVIPRIGTGRREGDLR